MELMRDMVVGALFPAVDTPAMVWAVVLVLEVLTTALPRSKVLLPVASISLVILNICEPCSKPVAM